ncbi:MULTISPECIES: helix-turn-helix domain-containing protein [unclassified Shinella]|uniref:helix-turn-helix domain-containing protein n=1 Tax=unclassified Shinella TaxID=2643062 RepID=UPI00225CEA26|nr:helix-turn-helix transcriptional regulator [Shinella sp. YE25]CAI0333982.1 conserved hypothetical protein [Rhizobiaceae bacterium]CAK7261626.1 XRE family transcriptional regulator [Shinella sp. WSC3-e]
MPIESPADIISHLAQRMEDKGTSPRKLAQLTGVPENRFELIQTGDWENLTIREIAVISEALDVDLCSLIIGGSATL